MTMRCPRIWLALAGMFFAQAACASAPAPTSEADLDLRKLTVRGQSIVDAGGEVWRLSADASRGAKVNLTADGGLVISGETFSEAAATLVRWDGGPLRDYVFETHFSLAQPDLFIGHMLVISPYVADPSSGAGYRISYQFLMPGPFSNNSTGFYLYNTGTNAFKKSPYDATPLAGARCRLRYGVEYTAFAVVRNVAGGVNIRFFLYDRNAPNTVAAPLIDYTDTSASRLEVAGSPRVQVGSGGVIYSAAPVCFRDMRVYSIDRLSARLGAASRGPANDDHNALSRAAAPQATTLPNVISENMVVQRNRPIPVWGRGIDGDLVTVKLGKRTARARVVNGKWSVSLAPLPTGGPYMLSVAGGDRTVVVKNVLVGEVWVLGGQSNMSWWMESTTGAEQEIPRSNYPDIRFFSGWHPASDQPQFDLAGGTWKPALPALHGQFSAVGYYFAKALHARLHVPIGLLDTSTPATGIEVWIPDAAAQAVFAAYPRPHADQYPPDMGDWSVFYNGKVAPVSPAAVAGVLWYQGDGSSPELGYAYRNRIPGLIRSWRAAFRRDDLPFLLVQIPRFKGCSPEMRESQLLSVLHTPRAGIAVTLDIGEPDDIHPRNKRPVGERLSLIARAMVYRDKIECMGPIYRSMEVRRSKAYVRFDHCGSGLVLRGSGGLEICGVDGKYVPATAALVAGRTVVVSSPQVAHPVAVRYAWRAVPEIDLYNREGLLASPFRTREE